MDDRDLVVYWDASAVLSALFRDEHSEEALAWARRRGVHLLSSLGWAEVHAVIARIQRERALADVLVEAAREALEYGPWRLLTMSPRPDVTKDLARKWPLPGADLWHLALAKAVHAQLPELILLTFDGRLQAAAAGEGLAGNP